MTTTPELLRKLTSSLSRDEIAHLAQSNHAQEVSDKLRGWQSTITNMETELARAKEVPPRTERKLGKARKELRKADGDTAASLLNVVDELEEKLDADKRHVEYVKTELEKVKHTGP